VRVLFLTNNTNLGSTARILQSWIALGRENGIESLVVTRGSGDFADWLKANGVQHLIDPMPFVERRRPWKGLWHSWRVARFGRGADVVHCNEHDVYPFLIGLRRFLKVPVVCHVRFRVTRPWAEWAYGGSRCPDALLWTSQQQKDDSAEAVEGIVLESRQHIVTLGFDVQTYGVDRGQRAETRQKLGVAEDEILVGTASPLRPRKRLHEFIEIATRLAPRHPNAVFLIAGNSIVGDEEYQAQIERNIADAGLGRRLKWLGYLEPVEPFYHASDVQVSTSEYETFGNSVCEAMACARPVAAYQGGSVAEVLGDAGLVVETSNIDGLTAAVERLLVDEELRKALGNAARQRVRTCFNPQKSFEQLDNIYRSVRHPLSGATESTSVEQQSNNVCELRS
jgi:L-malate glycosyltransferase